MKTIQDVIRESMRDELSRKGHICLTGHLICSGLPQEEILEILAQERQRMEQEEKKSQSLILKVKDPFEKAWSLLKGKTNKIEQDSFKRSDRRSVPQEQRAVP
jgi:hypothetical protein